MTRLRRVGLVGFACNTGLGNATADFFAHLPFASWLVIDHPRLGVNRARLDDRCVVGGLEMPVSAVDQWLDGLDGVFAIQSGSAPRLWERAKLRAIATTLMPNAEWFNPDLPGLRHIDCFVAPTAHSADLLTETGFGARTVYIPHPIDTDRFMFRRRERAECFLHIAGWDDRDRKGTLVVLDAARRCPEESFIVRSQDARTSAPDNVRLLGPVARPEELYRDGDIAIQPSRYQGVGLPVRVPDAPPMNEFLVDPALLLPVRMRIGKLVGRPLPIAEVDADTLGDRIRRFHGSPIGSMSDAARARMTERSWTRLRPSLLHALGSDSVAALDASSPHLPDEGAARSPSVHDGSDSSRVTAHA